MQEITKELLLQWTDVLESGKYEQGQHVLCDAEAKPYRYCCLGVLADMLDPKGWSKPQPTDGAVKRVRRWKGDECDLNGVVEVGLNAHNLSQMELTAMNDNGSTFEEIATYIRERVG